MDVSTQLLTIFSIKFFLKQIMMLNYVRIKTFYSLKVINVKLFGKHKQTNIVLEKIKIRKMLLI